ncbi:MAG: MaoC/PaaZ C-terminal domain-containing protein [Pseudolabrys sp.]|nr:MaoC/PaaZ C-terminal domain-containing protein [Pseudolabrys sp.]MDP2298924.1 MaoC/PaaZ C-terminal domain-containing protein [Pseudolabrys sp.]
MAVVDVRHFEAVSEGETFVLLKGPVTTRQLVMYAGASGDYNRIHYDHAFACEAGLGGVIAHGMLTMGFAAECLSDWAGKGAFIERVQGRFLHPVRPGDEVRITLTVNSKQAKRQALCCEVELSGEVSDRAVFSGSGTVVLPS